MGHYDGMHDDRCVVLAAHHPFTGSPSSTLVTSSVFVRIARGQRGMHAARDQRDGNVTSERAYHRVSA